MGRLRSVVPDAPTWPSSLTVGDTLLSKLAEEQERGSIFVGQALYPAAQRVERAPALYFLPVDDLSAGGLTQCTWFQLVLLDMLLNHDSVCLEASQPAPLLPLLLRCPTGRCTCPATLLPMDRLRSRAAGASTAGSSPQAARAAAAAHGAAAAAAHGAAAGAFCCADAPVCINVNFCSKLGANVFRCNRAQACEGHA